MYINFNLFSERLASSVSSPSKPIISVTLTEIFLCAGFHEKSYSGLKDGSGDIMTPHGTILAQCSGLEQLNNGVPSQVLGWCWTGTSRRPP